MAHNPETKKLLRNHRAINTAQAYAAMALDVIVKALTSSSGIDADVSQLDEIRTALHTCESEMSKVQRALRKLEDTE